MMSRSTVKRVSAAVSLGRTLGSARVVHDWSARVRRTQGRTTTGRQRTVCSARVVWISLLLLLLLLSGLRGPSVRCVDLAHSACTQRPDGEKEKREGRERWDGVWWAVGG